MRAWNRVKPPKIRPRSAKSNRYERTPAEILAAGYPNIDFSRVEGTKMIYAAYHKRGAQMKITDFAFSLGKIVEVACYRPDLWIAHIDKVGFPIGLVTVNGAGNTPAKAIESLTEAFNNQTLVVDGNTDRKREVGPTALEAA